MSQFYGKHQPIGTVRYGRTVSIPPEVKGISQFRDKSGKLLFNVEGFDPDARELIEIKHRVHSRIPPTPGGFCLVDLLLDIHQGIAIRQLGLDIGKNSRKFGHLHTVL